MNKSHITDEQVERAIGEWSIATRISIKELSWEDAEGVRRNMRRALEAASPEPSIQELLSDEERSERHDDPQKPAAFGPLVVSEDDAEEINYAKDIREALQSFVDRHSIKPIAFADRRPENGQDVWIYEPFTKTETIESFECWYSVTWTDSTPWKYKHAWLPASALPIPEPTVDAKESAWKRYELQEWDRVLAPSKTDFKAGYEAGQAGGNK